MSASIDELKLEQSASASSARSFRSGNEAKAWVTKGPKQAMVLETVDLGPLGAEDVEVAVEHCGLCHSDLSIFNNDWGVTQYPAILGHEVIGRISALGPNAKGLEIGQLVGVGWNSGSCMHCRQCMSGSQHLCPQVQATIVGHRGGFASHIRAHWAWAIPLPEKLNLAEAGPLLCGGVTVFSPLAMYAKPTQRVGIIGIGGLGHMGVKFASAFGCDVTAFTSRKNKVDEARRFGANEAFSSDDSAAIQKLAGSLDLLISTVNVKIDWDAMIGMLAPNGRLHVVGVVLEPIPVVAFSLIMQQRSMSGSPTGSPVTIQTMLEFAARHNIIPQNEHYPMSRINDAMARLESGKAHYRIVLDSDFEMSSQAKTAIVTGASQGIGAAVVKRFVEHGFNVVANSRNITKSTEIAASTQVALVDGHIGEQATAARIVETALSRFQSVDVLVNNAGIFFTKPFTDYTAEDFKSLVSTNAEGFLYVTQLSIRQMLAQKTGGSIVTITASLARNPIRGVTAAVPMFTKGGLETITRHLAMEYAKDHIRVNAVGPGVVETPLHRDTPADVMKSLSPMGQPSTAMEIADAVMYLTGAPTVTGNTLYVDGGSHFGRW